MVYQWIKSIQSALFPSICLLCGVAGEEPFNLCRACRRELPHCPRACQRCAVPLIGVGTSPLCGACQRQPPLYEHCHAALDYAYPVDYLIQRFKFHGDLVAGKTLGHLLLNSLEARPPPIPDTLIPVPLHRSRLRERGFNQTALLATHLGRSLHIPVVADAVERGKTTPAQAGLSIIQRRDNLRGVFESRLSLANQHVVIVDDVMTSGHTADELGRCLRRAGARRVDVWLCARAQLN
ncbi:MAG TPA: ComF family protein [Chromatiales bacterium]|nr:ComF family protein [Chromatiaceae bacterium]HIN82226.1 ComF family protein [Chromatiales bacterium]HIO54073.1 ComF family protein [Chromatiales bacterium]